MRRVGVFFFLGVLAAVLALAPPAATENRQVARGESAVSAWIPLQLQGIASHRVNPPRAARGLALVSVAMYRAERVVSAGSAIEDAASSARSRASSSAFVNHCRRDWCTAGTTTRNSSMSSPSAARNAATGRSEELMTRTFRTIVASPLIGRCCSGDARRDYGTRLRRAEQTSSPTLPSRRVARRRAWTRESRAGAGRS